MCYYCIICDNVYCYVIAIVFVWEALNGTIALLCCHVSMKLDVGLTKPLPQRTGWPSAATPSPTPQV